jgi:hypothetical protein
VDKVAGFLEVGRTDDTQKSLLSIRIQSWTQTAKPASCFRRDMHAIWRICLLSTQLMLKRRQSVHYPRLHPIDRGFRISDHLGASDFRQVLALDRYSSRHEGWQTA